MRVLTPGYHEGSLGNYGTPLQFGKAVLAGRVNRRTGR